MTFAFSLDIVGHYFIKLYDIIIILVDFLCTTPRAGEPEPEPVGAGCFWLLGAGAA